jgi:MGT family glycosyltransferase
LSVFCLIALTLTYRYKIPVILLRTQCTLLSRREELRKSIASGLLQVSGKIAELCHLLQKSGISVSSVADLTHLAFAIPEIVLLPPDFEPESDYRAGQAVYAGAALETETITEAFPWEAMDPSRKIIYCSLGTRPDLQRMLSLRFFRLAIDAMAEQPEFQMILSTGRRISPHELGTPAPNVYIADWVPQGEVLKRAALMITHGGLGSIKECICAGIPMVVFPVMRDQFCGAERVVRLGLGMRGQIANVSTGELLRLIQTVTGCSAFKSRVMTMREHFLRPDLGAAVALIENAAKPA